MTPKEIDTLLARLRAAETQGQVDRVVEVLVTEVDLHGVEALRPFIAARGSAPGVAAALAKVSSRGRVDIVDVFDEEEVLDGVVEYLRQAGQPGDLTHDWAWEGIWFGRLPRGRRLELILKLLPRVTDNDLAFWLVGDGPLSSVEMEPGGVERVEELERTNPLIKRVRDAVIADLYGQPLGAPRPPDKGSSP